MRQKLTIAALSALLSLGGGATAAAPDKRPFDAKNLQFDVVRLGAPIGAFEGKYPKTLCDTDPINQGTRQLWFHAGRPCRNADPLPGGTIVVLFTKTESPTSPIDAIAWFGNWPHASGNFPLDIGVQLPEVEAALGKAHRQFDFAKVLVGGEEIVVWQHTAALYSITRKGRVFGYAAGIMGADRDSEEWRGLISNVMRYSK